VLGLNSFTTKVAAAGECRCVDSTIANDIHQDIDSAFILKEEQRTAIKAVFVPSENISSEKRLCNSDYACKGRSMKCKNNRLDISITTLRPLWRLNLNTIKIHINKRLTGFHSCTYQSL